MQSIEDFEPTGAFEAIKVLGRELQHSKEKIKNLENDIRESRGPSDPVDPDAAKALAQRAEKAEAQVAQLREDLANAENTEIKLNLKIEKLQSRIEKLKVVKQEQQEAQLPVDSNGDRPLANHDIELETQLQTEAKLKRDAIANSDDLKKEVLRLEALLKKEVAESRPVCLASTNLRTYLEAVRSGSRALIQMKLTMRLYWCAFNPESFRVTQSMICLPNPERLLWASTTCQVGLAFGPLYRYTGSQRGWTKDSEFTRRYGKDVELFFTNGDHVYYAGRYKCHDIRAQNPRGCFRRDAKSAEALADVTFDSHTGSRNDGMWQMVNALYRDGILKAECAILHCVGFNHKVHDILASRPGTPTSTPTPTTPTTTVPAPTGTPIAGADTSTSDVVAAFNQYNVTTRFGITFNPTAILGVAFTGQTQSFKAGQSVARNITATTPQLSLYGIGADPGPGPFVIVMADPDVPTPQNPSFGPVRHWLAGNYYPTRTSNVLTPSGTAITPYFQPTPGVGSPAHRYTYLLYKQPSNFNQQMIVTSQTSIVNWNVSQFASRAGLGDPIAGTFMMVTM
ncbi:hypothetical protein MD484_g8218, partial [Candolleomyces efflorescens]